MRNISYALEKTISAFPVSCAFSQMNFSHIHLKARHKFFFLKFIEFNPNMLVLLVLVILFLVIFFFLFGTHNELVLGVFERMSWYLKELRSYLFQKRN